MRRVRRVTTLHEDQRSTEEEPSTESRRCVNTDAPPPHHPATHCARTHTNTRTRARARTHTNTRLMVLRRYPPPSAGSKQNDRWPGRAAVRYRCRLNRGAARRRRRGGAGVQKKSNLKPMEDDVYTMCARLCVCACERVYRGAGGNIEKRPFHKMAAHSLH